MKVIKLYDRRNVKSHFFEQPWLKFIEKNWLDSGINIVNLDSLYLDNLNDKFYQMCERTKKPYSYWFDSLRLRAIADISTYDDICYLDNDVIVTPKFIDYVQLQMQNHKAGFIQNPGLCIYCKKGEGWRLQRYLNFYDKYAPLAENYPDTDFRRNTDCVVDARLASLGLLTHISFRDYNSFHLHSGLTHAIMRVVNTREECHWESGKCNDVSCVHPDLIPLILKADKLRWPDKGETDRYACLLSTLSDKVPY